MTRVVATGPPAHLRVREGIMARRHDPPITSKDDPVHALMSVLAPTMQADEGASGTMSPFSGQTYVRPSFLLLRPPQPSDVLMHTCQCKPLLRNLIGRSVCTEEAALLITSKPHWPHKFSPPRPGFLRDNLNILSPHTGIASKSIIHDEMRRMVGGYNSLCRTSTVYCSPLVIVPPR
jgi:hypothetical protein